MLEEDILCRLSSTVLTTAPSSLGLPQVYRLGDSRKEARRQIQIIQDEIESLKTAQPDLEVVISRVLHNSIENRER